MSRRIISIVAVLAVAAVVASAQPVAAADAGLEVASANTSDTELSNATTLDNVSVLGSGQSATATLQSPRTDSFEDGDIAEYNGDKTPFTVVSSPVIDGSNSLELDPTTGGGEIADGGFTASQGDTIEYRVRLSGPDANAYLLFGIQDASGPGQISQNHYAARVSTRRGEIGLEKQAGGSFSQVSSTATSIPTGKWLTAEITWTTGGQITLELRDGASTVATTSGTDTAFTSGALGTKTLGTGNDVAYLDNITVNPSAAGPGVYIGARHDASQAKQLFADLTLTNASATVTAQADPDADGSYTNVTSTAVSTTQNVTLDVSATDSTRWRTRVDFSRQSGTTTAELDSEGVLFQAATPGGSGAAPTGQISTFDGDISLNVSDADFALAQGDSVTVEATNATGGTIGSTTISSNQSVSFSYAAKAGQNDITWTLTDSYGEAATVSQSFTTPATLSVYNESDPDSLITGTQNEITVSFYGQQDSVFQKTTTDGTVNLSGLPAAPADGYEITVTDGEEYRSRRIVVDSLFEQRSVYLLPASATFYDVRFQLQDFTGGNFEPEETQLYVAGPITKDFDGDGNTSTRYQTILASSFDVGSGFPTELIADKRYRLRIVNDQGDSRIIGSYTPSEDTVEPITIKGLEFQPPEGQGWETTLNTTSPASSDGRTLTWKYKDPSGETSRLNVSVTNESGSVVYQDTVRDGVQNYSVYGLQLANDSDYTLAWNATRRGQQIGQTRPVGGTGPLIAIPFDTDWLGTLGMLGVVFVLALADRQKTSYVAMSAVAMAGIMMAIQAVTIFEPLWFLAALLAVGSHLKTMQQPEI